MTIYKYEMNLILPNGASSHIELESNTFMDKAVIESLVYQTYNENKGEVIALEYRKDELVKLIPEQLITEAEIKALGQEDLERKALEFERVGLMMIPDDKKFIDTQKLQAIIERECSLFQIEHEEVKRERWSVKLGY